MMRRTVIGVVVLVAAWAGAGDRRVCAPAGGPDLLTAVLDAGSWTPDAGSPCGALEWSARGRVKAGRWAAGVWWDGGTEACVTIASERRDGGVELVTGTLPAGHSDRYSEDFAPVLLSRALEIDGRAFPLMTTPTMGMAGGGGESLSALVPTDGGVTVRHLGSINGAISLNTYVESNAASCFDVLQQKGRRVSLEACFDGKLGAPRCFDWTGTDFVRLK